MTRLSPRVDKAFRKWINNRNWHTGHPDDQERFYKFVWTVVKFSKRHPSESDIRDLVVNMWSGRLEHNYLTHIAQEYSGLYTKLLVFAKVRNKIKKNAQDSLQRIDLTAGTAP